LGLGALYWGLFGICHTIIVERFGLAYLSENLGYISFAPLIGGNLFSLMFDAHTPTPDTHLMLLTRILRSLVPRELLSEHQCFDGRECYVGGLGVTMAACVISLGLSVWAGSRDRQEGKESRMGASAKGTRACSTHFL